MAQNQLASDSINNLLCYKLLRATLLFLVFFDIILGVVGVGFPQVFIMVFKLNTEITGAMYQSGLVEPIFIRGVGILWFLAAYVQFLAWKDPASRPLVINIALIFRFCGGTFELIESLILLPLVGYSYVWGHVTLAIFYIGDYLLIAFMIYLLKKCNIRWWKIF